MEMSYETVTIVFPAFVDSYTVGIDGCEAIKSLNDGSLKIKKNERVLRFFGLPFYGKQAL